MLKIVRSLPALGLLAVLPTVGRADLITNGSFELLTNGYGEIGYNTDATGWTTTGYNFVYGSGIADTTGAVGSGGRVKLWGPGTGSSNGLPTSSPDGGNFIAADGAYQTKAITQSITGLTVGHTYALSFYWGAGQQSGFNGDTTDQWKVTLGSTTQSTSVASIPSHGFSGWQYQTFDYVATAPTETLSFLANGTPTGVPPFALLDGVTMTDLQGPNVPEPGTLAWISGCLLGLGVCARRRAHARR